MLGAGIEPRNTWKCSQSAQTQRGDEGFRAEAGAGKDITGVFMTQVMKGAAQAFKFSRRGCCVWRVSGGGKTSQ